MNRGEIRWYTFRPPNKRRPVLILTRTEIIEPWWSGVTEVELDRVAIAPNGSFVMSYERPRPRLDDDIMSREHGGLVVRRTEDGSILAIYDVPYLTRSAIAPDSKTFVYATPPHRQLADLALVHVPP